MGYAYLKISTLYVSSLESPYRNFEGMVKSLDLPADVEVVKIWWSANQFDPTGATGILALLKSETFIAETPEKAFDEPPLVARAKEKPKCSL